MKVTVIRSTSASAPCPCPWCAGADTCANPRAAAALDIAPPLLAAPTPAPTPTPTPTRPDDFGGWGWCKHGLVAPIATFSPAHARCWGVAAKRPRGGGGAATAPRGRHERRAATARNPACIVAARLAVEKVGRGRFGLCLSCFLVGACAWETNPTGAKRFHFTRIYRRLRGGGGGKACNFQKRSQRKAVSTLPPELPPFAPPRYGSRRGCEDLSICIAQGRGSPREGSERTYSSPAACLHLAQRKRLENFICQAGLAGSGATLNP